MGEVDIDEKQIVNFPDGLFGFETLQRYALLDSEQPPFYWLQSLDESDLAFVLIDPFVFHPDFEMNADDAELASIGIKEPGQALVFSIVRVPDSGPITANLQGPLVINRDTQQGRQIILNDPRWKTRHDIVAEMKAAESRSGPC
jgi:flagellar assembly factor FliW